MQETFKGDGWKATSILAKLRMNLGGVPGAAASQTQAIKSVTAFADTVAKAVFTVTVPNSKADAVIEVDVLGALGAGGAIGAGEASKAAKYQVIVTRTAGVAAVVGVSAAIGGIGSAVAGAATVTSVVVTASAVSGAVGAVNTFTILVAITKSGGASDNHTAIAFARLINQFGAGVTIA